LVHAASSSLGELISKRVLDNPDAFLAAKKLCPGTRLLLENAERRAPELSGQLVFSGSGVASDADHRYHQNNRN
jgi:hypothetical protein